MKPHIKGEHEHPKFDRRVMRTLLFFAAAAFLGYLMNVGHWEPGGFCSFSISSKSLCTAQCGRQISKKVHGLNFNPGMPGGLKKRLNGLC